VKRLPSALALLLAAGLAAAGERTPVAEHGMLRVRGAQIVDQAGAPVQLRGLSLFWSQWGHRFWNEDAIGYVVRSWHVTVVRAAMGVGKGGYLQDPEREKARVKRVVEIAVELGIYVIIDWHDHEATFHRAEAEAFFKEMAALYRGVPNVLFEPFNEPLVSDSWESVKEYSERIARIIRGQGAKQIILVGTPSWSRDVDSAALDPIRRFKDVAYVLHFYAGDHRSDVREKAAFAMARGAAVFVSEWGTCLASGDGGFAPAESDRWIRFMDQHRISWLNWALNDKAETASILRPGAAAEGGWTDEDLTESGRYVRDRLLRKPLETP
jgi:endoglucanase